MLNSENVFTNAIKKLDVSASRAKVYRDTDYSKSAFPGIDGVEPPIGFGERYATLTLALDRLSTSTDRFKADYQWACRSILPRATMCLMEVECIDLYKMVGWAGVKKCS